MNNVPNFILALLSTVLYSVLFPACILQAQRSYNSDYRPVVSTKSVVDYYENMDDKSFYQQKRIHGIKGELNNYSEKLHNLQDRFDKIFYGLSSQGSFKTPFDTSKKPDRPVFERNFEPNVTGVESDKQNTHSPIINNPVEPLSSQNQLAFNVNSPGSFTKDDQVVSTFNPNARSGLGYYFLLRPGVAFPYKIHKNSQSYKRYDPGFSAVLAGGFKVNGFKIGLGSGYKKNSFHDTSKLYTTSKHLTGACETFSGYLDLGYEFNLVNSIDAYLGLGVGYYLSLIEDNKDLSSRKEHDLFVSGSAGMAWRFSELFALSIGYRYFYENEAPAHLAELGLNFEF